MNCRALAERSAVTGRPTERELWRTLRWLVRIGRTIGSAARSRTTSQVPAVGAEEHREAQLALTLAMRGSDGDRTHKFSPKELASHLEAPRGAAIHSYAKPAGPLCGHSPPRNCV
eukprot:SAG11_NODE_1279_length_5314_cov_3.403835_1_plen_115_part_00